MCVVKKDIKKDKKNRKNQLKEGQSDPFSKNIQMIDHSVKRQILA